MALLGFKFPFVGSPGQILGSAAGDNANTGNDGEYIASNIAPASAISLTTATPVNLTNVVIGAGDWDLVASIVFLPAATTSVTQLIASLSTTTGTLDQTVANRFAQDDFAAMVPTAAISLHIPRFRTTFNASLTWFLVLKATFTVSTMTAYGHLSARRMR